jgi:hypothetical protein
MDEWLGGRDKHAMCVSREICFHSIRNMSANHMYNAVLFFFIVLCLSFIGGDKTIILV